MKGMSVSRGAGGEVSKGVVAVGDGASVGTGVACGLATCGNGGEHATGTWLLWQHRRANGPGRTTMLHGDVVH
jgi:hypothetical protein